MSICKIEEQYTGGGCEHLSVYFPEYNLEFTVMSANEYTTNDIPKDGEKWCFNLSQGGKWIDGEYLETSETMEDFDLGTIDSWCEGYIIAKGYKKIPQGSPFYSVEELHGSVCDIFAQLDDGEIEEKTAIAILRACCVKFLNDNIGE